MNLPDLDNLTTQEAIIQLEKQLKSLEGTVLRIELSVQREFVDDHAKDVWGME